jgi:hypothetical protein
MRGLVIYRLLQVALHSYQSVCKPLWLLLKQVEAGLHGCGKYFFSLQRQFRLFFPEAVSPLSCLLLLKRWGRRFNRTRSIDVCIYSLFVLSCVYGGISAG